MNQSSPTFDAGKRLAAGDPLDRLFSTYLKGQMKQPWPAAPATSSLGLGSEPSTLLAARSTPVDSPRNQPAGPETSPSPRYKLAVSAAVLLGACWCLSNGFQSSVPTGPSNTAPVTNMFQDATAGKPAVLEEVRKEKAINGQDAPPAPKIQLP